MRNLITSNLRIEISAGQSPTIMKWLGFAREQDYSQEVIPYIQQITAELHGQDLTVSFEELEYMNSSAMLAIIELMKNLNKYQVRSTFTYRKESFWQTTSFKVLVTLSRGLEYIHVRAI